MHLLHLPMTILPYPSVPWTTLVRTIVVYPQFLPLQIHVLRLHTHHPSLPHHVVTLLVLHLPPEMSVEVVLNFVEDVLDRWKSEDLRNGSIVHSPRLDDALSISRHLVDSTMIP